MVRWSGCRWLRDDVVNDVVLLNEVVKAKDRGQLGLGVQVHGIDL